jgi:uncharacterized protein with von Willebrand factor type A (vWA) domain
LRVGESSLREMSGRRAKKTGVKDRQYVGIEKGLSIANREYISIPADAMEVTRKITEVVGTSARASSK